jgi:hypothetical protein
VGTRRRKAALLVGGCRSFTPFWRSRYDDEIRLLLAGLEAAVPDAEVVLDYERTRQTLEDWDPRPGSGWDQDELARREEAKKRREELEELRLQKWRRRREEFLRKHPEAIELEAAQPGPRPTAGFFDIREWERRAEEWERRVATYLEEHPEAEGLVFRPVRPAAQDFPIVSNVAPPLPLPGDVLVQVVLPTAVGAIVTAVIQTAVGWLRSLGRKPEREHAVLIYGPNGEPLRKIRLRPGRRKPEIFKRDWPLPPE